MKRILFGILLAMIALALLAACRNSDPEDSDDSHSKASSSVSSITAQPPPITVTERPIPPTHEQTVVTTEVPHPSTTTEPVTTKPVTTEPPVTTTTTTTVVTTTGTGPVLGENDNHTDWGPIVPMEPTPLPQ